MVKLAIPHSCYLGILLAIVATSALAGATDEIEFGRALFEGKRSFTHEPQVAGVPIPLRDAHCSTCHGLHGQGRAEGGMTAPSIQWRTLTNTRSGLPGYDSINRILAAIEKGDARASSTSLAELMPRFNLTNAERNALITYLQVIGTEAAPVRGVAADAITLGTALPLTGMHAAVGNSVLQAMQQRINAINATGGILGRTLQLKTADTAANGVDAAIFDLIYSQHIFALVGSWLADPSDALMQALTVSNTPSIGAVGMPISTQQHRLATYILPSLQQQIASALAFLQKRCASELGGEIWYANEKDLPAITPVSEVISGTSETRLPLHRAVHVINIQQQIKKTIESHLTDKLIFLLPSDDVEQIYSQLATSQICVATLASVSSSPRQSSDRANQIMIFPVPQRSVITMDLWTMLGNAAVGLIAEAIARAGRILDQDRLISVLDNSQEFEPVSGLSIRFTPKVRHALVEGFIWQ